MQRNNFMTTLSQQIKKHRKSHGIIQSVIAAKVGLTRSQYCVKECNDSFTHKQIYRICEELGVEIILKAKDGK